MVRDIIIDERTRLRQLATFQKSRHTTAWHSVEPLVETNAQLCILKFIVYELTVLSKPSKVIQFLDIFGRPQYLFS